VVARVPQPLKLKFDHLGAMTSKVGSPERQQRISRGHINKLLNDDAVKNNYPGRIQPPSTHHGTRIRTQKNSLFSGTLDDTNLSVATQMPTIDSSKEQRVPTIKNFDWSKRFASPQDDQKRFLDAGASLSS